MTTRADFRPGMIVERRERYLVRGASYPPKGHPNAENAGRAHRNGARKLTPLDGEWVIVRGRWSVRRVPPLEIQELRTSAYWVAYMPPREDDLGWSFEKRQAFATFAEAIAYADQKAREQ